MINKYVELHEKLMDLLVKYYNQHTYFINRPSWWSSRELVSTIMEMNRVIKEIKKNNLAMRKEFREEIKAKKAAKQSKGESK